MTKLTLTAEHSGERLDAFLAANVEDLTRSAAQKLMEKGAVTIAGRPVKKNEKTAPGMIIEVELPDPEPIDVVPQNIPLDVAYEDSDVIVINKPVGMVVHPAAGNPTGTLVNALLYHCGSSLSGVGGVIRPGIVHRIDKDTSGLLVVAKHDVAHLKLAEQLKGHHIRRTYYAIAIGNLKEESGTVDAPIGRHPIDRKRMAVLRGADAHARDAVTHYRVLERFDGLCHVECRLETGRTHQIRVQMAGISHPVFGDMRYGLDPRFKFIVSRAIYKAMTKFIARSNDIMMLLTK